MNLWHSPRLLNALSNGLLMLFCGVFVLAVSSWLAGLPTFDLKAVMVRPIGGGQFVHLDLKDLERRVPRHIPGTFFTVDLRSVREAFEAQPWVRHAEVRRIWPDRLLVSIEEQRPLARWQGGGMVNLQGEWFDPRFSDPRQAARIAPILFDGPPGTQALVKQQYDELLHQLEPLRLRPKVVRLSERLAWSAVLDSGLEVLIGRDDRMPVRDRVARWVSVHAALEARLNHTAQVIDLRYSNGFAVRAPAALEPVPAGRRGQTGSSRRP